MKSIGQAILKVKDEEKKQKLIRAYAQKVSEEYLIDDDDFVDTFAEFLDMLYSRIERRSAER